MQSMFLYKKSLWVMAIGVPLMSSCTYPSHYFSLLSPVSQQETTEVNSDSVAVRQSLPGLLELTSQQPGSEVKLLIRTDKSFQLSPTISVVATNKNQDPVDFSHANISSIYESQRLPSWSIDTWYKELAIIGNSYKSSNLRKSIFLPWQVAIFSAEPVGHYNRYLNRSTFVNNPHKSWFFGHFGVDPKYYDNWSFSRSWFKLWHGKRGFLFKMHESGLYPEAEIKETALAIGNYLVPVVLEKGDSVAGTVSFSKVAKGEGSSLYKVIVQVGEDKHLFHIFLNS